jgi:hypothetical protein
MILCFSRKKSFCLLRELLSLHFWARMTVENVRVYKIPASAGWHGWLCDSNYTDVCQVQPELSSNQKC